MQTAASSDILEYNTSEIDPTIEQKQKEINDIILSSTFIEWEYTYKPNIPASKELIKKENKNDLLKIPENSEDFLRINSKYYFNKKYILGKGGFGKVFYGTDINRKKDYAIKFQNSLGFNNINKEVEILSILKNEEGFPEIYCYGNLRDQKYIVESLLGPSIEKLFIFCDKKFNLGSVVKIGKDMIKRLKQLHNKNIIHRDIKPNNFTFGKFHSVIDDDKLNKKHKKTLIKYFNYFENELLYLIDFGLSVYQNNQGVLHLTNFIGTPRYACLNSHYNKNQCKRDDLESVFYVIMYLYKGYLPWENLEIKDKETKLNKIRYLKEQFDQSDFYINLPPQFQIVYQYIKQLNCNSVIDYNYIINCLDVIISINNIERNSFNFLWDWEMKILTNYNNSVILNKNKSLFNTLFSGYPIVYQKYYNYIRRKYNEIEFNALHI